MFSCWKITFSRIIPTRMGTSDGIKLAANSVEDHPHAYGDKSFENPHRPAHSGSSPRVWGQVTPETLAHTDGGIIPTRMGTSRSLSSLSTLDKGSSPRVWGQESVWLSIIRMTRIIPTRMGTSICFSSCPVGCRDHPHAYGDKDSKRFFPEPTAGSSPRVWGQVYDIYFLLNCLGIIPTRMGTSMRFLPVQAPL